MSVENRVVLITGATGGLGRTAAREFARQGARLVLVGTSVENLMALAQSLSLSDSCFLIHVDDLSKPEAASRLVAQALQKFGRIDILLHLIGGWSGGKLIPAVTHGEIENMLQQHLWTTFHLALAILPSMTANGWGRLLVVSSPIDAHPNAKTGSYAIGKAAQEALMLTIAEEAEGSGVTANILLVDTIDVDHARDQNPDATSKNWTTPEEITAAFLRLSSDEAGSINGVRIPVYGRQKIHGAESAASLVTIPN